MGMTGFTFGAHAEFLKVKSTGAVVKKPEKCFFS